MTRKPEEVKAAIAAQVWPEDTQKIASTYVWVPVRALEAMFQTAAYEDRRVLRYTVMRYLVGKESTKDLTDSECNALVAWAHTPEAPFEAALILNKCGEDNGQQRLF